MTPAAAPAATARRSWWLAALLASLVMIGPFSVDAYLPAFPAIGRELAVPAVAVQGTLSAYLFAYAFMMLWHGALSDALGRRPVILAGMIVFAIATLGCAIAGNIQSLLLFRALQGLSAGTGLVVGRAIIRDRFHGPEAQKMMSQITQVFAIAPAIGPIVGGALLNAFGWRSIFWSLLVFTLLTLAWAARKLPETLPPELRQPLHPPVLWRNYKAVTLRPEYVMLVLMTSLNFCAFFLYIAGAPNFLVNLLHVSTMGFGWLFIPMIGGVMIGATLSGRLAGRITPARTVGFGYAFMFLAVALNLAFALLAPPLVAIHVAPIMIFTIGSSMAMPSITVLMLDLFPSNRGLASSLQGFVQFALGGLVAGTVVPLVDQTLVGLAIGMAVFTLASWLLWLAYRRRGGASKG